MFPAYPVDGGCFPWQREDTQEEDWILGGDHEVKFWIC